MKDSTKIIQDALDYSFSQVYVDIFKVVFVISY